MMTSEVYVWVFLPEQREPVVAGRVVALSDRRLGYLYGRSYLERADAVAIGPDLPLRRGVAEPVDGAMRMPSTVRDACPDAWGQRVIRWTLTGDADSPDPDWSIYMLRSGSNRIGFLDFQVSATEYVPRVRRASMEDMVRAAELIDTGLDVPEDLRAAIEPGTSIGGARPKVDVTLDGVAYIAKLATSTDTAPVVQHEAVAMDLAARAGLDVAHTRLASIMGRRALMVRRFDRDDIGGRRQVVSGLTLLDLDEMHGRYATYPDILDRIDRRSIGGSAGREMFSRIAFNMAVSNSDDHARNTAAFWDGEHLALSPAYDICPGPRSGETATQAMAYGVDGERASSLVDLIGCSKAYGLSRREAGGVVDDLVTSIHEHFEDAADRAELTSAERKRMWGRQILNPGTTRGIGRPSPRLASLGR